MAEGDHVLAITTAARGIAPHGPPSGRGPPSTGRAAGAPSAAPPAPPHPGYGFHDHGLGGGEAPAPVGPQCARTQPVRDAVHRGRGEAQGELGRQQQVVWVDQLTNLGPASGLGPRAAPAPSPQPPQPREGPQQGLEGLAHLEGGRPDRPPSPAPLATPSRGRGRPTRTAAAAALAAAAGVAPEVVLVTGAPTSPVPPLGIPLLGRGDAWGLSEGGTVGQAGGYANVPLAAPAQSSRVVASNPAAPSWASDAPERPRPMGHASCGLCGKPDHGNDVFRPLRAVHVHWARAMQLEVCPFVVFATGGYVDTGQQCTCTEHNNFVAVPPRTARCTPTGGRPSTPHTLHLLLHGMCGRGGGTWVALGGPHGAPAALAYGAVQFCSS